MKNIGVIEFVYDRMSFLASTICVGLNTNNIHVMFNCKILKLCK